MNDAILKVQWPPWTQNFHSVSTSIAQGTTISNKLFSMSVEFQTEEDSRQTFDLKRLREELLDWNIVYLTPGSSDT